MVTKNKRTTNAKKLAKKTAPAAPDFEKAAKVMREVIHENSDWLREMAKK